ncbi:hypothetical protein M407DRAFT_242545 [Tulasnella calospora MUT 4182]|uniref:Sphingolipid long chain base-responsive protein LSP1 n=1 Tax=Tulasnella calospora MUT 4182 TaxID=1051891 RepID=A0A0C3M7L0_9AGAM|nr:hypothetical protein M407DRAFT_242545 [Tulasnella calospora MUT 4182]
MESLTHQLKALHNQYAPQGPPEVRNLQVLITNAKGVALDYEALGRDTKSLSKDFYLWGQEEEEDIKDVTDRLAYLNFVQGSLISVLSDRLDEARAPLKKLREAQAALSPRRSQRASIETQVQALQTNPNAKPGSEARIKELQDTLSKHNADDAPMEREVAELRRKAIRESEEMKWEAFKEFGEKLLLLNQASTQIVAQLPATAPTQTNPYNGHARTAAARTALQTALDNWKPGMITMPTSVLPTEVDKRTFGESHASELSRVGSFRDSTKADHTAAPTAAPTAASTTAPTAAPTTSGSTVANPAPPQSHPVVSANKVSPSTGAVDPAQLNNSPAPIPAPVSSMSSGVAPGKIEASAVTSPDPNSELHAASIAPPGPTVAETGIPVTSTGAGPASGSLTKEALHGPSSSTAPPYDQPPSSSGPGWGVGGFRSDVQVHESAEDEKKRLEREDRERILAANTTAQVAPAGQPAPYESAEEEKKRLEREEREKLLRGGPSSQPGDRPPPPSGPPPSYS